MPSTIRATTQQHLDIEDVLDNLILLKDGSCAMVLQTNAINFGLLSEEEQDSTIYAYAALLNSLTFTIQLVIRSELKDISAYLKLLDEQELKQQDSLKKRQIKNYKEFINSFVADRNVLEKKFYLVIPFSTLELGISQSFSSSFSGKKGLPFDKTYITDKARTNLEPRRDHLLRQLGRLGLSARQLNTQELIQLMFSMYNPGNIQGQKITNTNDYTTTMVKPAFTTAPTTPPTPPQPPASSPNNQNLTPTTPQPTPIKPLPPAPQPVQPQPTPAIIQTREKQTLSQVNGASGAPTLSRASGAPNGVLVQNQAPTLSQAPNGGLNGVLAPPQPVLQTPLVQPSPQQPTPPSLPTFPSSPTIIPPNQNLTINVPTAPSTTSQIGGAGGAPTLSQVPNGNLNDALVQNQAPNGVLAPAVADLQSVINSAVNDLTNH